MDGLTYFYICLPVAIFIIVILIILARLLRKCWLRWRARYRPLVNEGSEDYPSARPGGTSQESGTSSPGYTTEWSPYTSETDPEYAEYNRRQAQWRRDNVHGSAQETASQRTQEPVGDLQETEDIFPIEDI